MWVNHLPGHPHKTFQGAVESSVADAAAGDEDRGDRRRELPVQSGAIAKLVHRLRDIGGANDVLAGPLRLAKFKYQRATRSSNVGLVARHKPVEDRKGWLIP